MRYLKLFIELIGAGNFELKDKQLKWIIVILLVLTLISFAYDYDINQETLDILNDTNQIQDIINSNALTSYERRYERFLVIVTAVEDNTATIRYISDRLLANKLGVYDNSVFSLLDYPKEYLDLKSHGCTHYLRDNGSIFLYPIEEDKGSMIGVVGVYINPPVLDCDDNSCDSVAVRRSLVICGRLGRLSRLLSK